MRSVFQVLLYVVAGGAAFWAPDIALRAHRGHQFSGKDILLLNVLLLWTLFTCYGVLLWLSRRWGGGPSVGVFMLVGVWMLGPFCMMSGLAFSGAGFAAAPVDAESVFWLIVATFVPAYTYIMAAYAGTLLGLLLATALMVTVHLKFERGRWALPAGLRRFMMMFGTRRRA